MIVETIKKTVVKTTDGHELKAGDEVLFLAGGRPIHGVFKGLSDKNYLKIETKVKGIDVTFNVTSASIKGLYKVALEVL